MLVVRLSDDIQKIKHIYCKKFKACKICIDCDTSVKYCEKSKSRKLLDYG